MSPLKFETYLSADTDREINQYKILGGLKEYLTCFNKKRVYPALTELVDLAIILNEVLKQRNNLNASFPKHISGYDFKNKKLIFESIDTQTPDIEFLFDMIEWSLPKIKEAIEEGIVLYEYVEKNLKIAEVGLIPIYKDEGYFIVPDNNGFVLQVHRFECSLFSSGNEPFRALKTRMIEEMKQSLLADSPESIKLNLISKYRDLPNPATYIWETDLDFPFAETLFPIAKRKLMSRVAA